MFHKKCDPLTTKWHSGLKVIHRRPGKPLFPDSKPLCVRQKTRSFSYTIKLNHNDTLFLPRLRTFTARGYKLQHNYYSEEITLTKFPI